MSKHPPIEIPSTSELIGIAQQAVLTLLVTKPKFKKLTSDKINVLHVDIFDPFTAVTIQMTEGGSVTCTGYTKRTFHCDPMDVERGVTIATGRAIKRALGLPVRNNHRPRQHEEVITL